MYCSVTLFLVIVLEVPHNCHKYAVNAHLLTCNFGAKYGVGVNLYLGLSLKDIGAYDTSTGINFIS